MSSIHIRGDYSTNIFQSSGRTVNALKERLAMPRASRSSEVGLAGSCHMRSTRAGGAVRQRQSFEITPLAHKQHR